MAEAFVNVTEGSGKKLRAFDRTIGANTVLEEGMFLAEQNMATYTCSPAAGISIATANDHTFEVMAGASLNLYIRRIEVYQLVAATTAAFCQFILYRLTTAGTGGTAQTVTALDNVDAAASATVMTLPTVKGTETFRIWNGTCVVTQTVAVAGSPTKLVDISFDPKAKVNRVPAGTTNGIGLKCITAVAAATVVFNVTWGEANF
jgi:hypothetical protein